MLKQDCATSARSLAPSGGRDAVAERLLALTFLAAFGVWMVLALAVGTASGPTARPTSPAGSSARPATAARRSGQVDGVVVE